MTDQGKFGYPYCPVCNKKLNGQGIDILETEKTIKCTNCGTKVTVVNEWFQPKIAAWEPTEEIQS